MSQCKTSFKIPILFNKKKGGLHSYTAISSVTLQQERFEFVHRCLFCALNCDGPYKDKLVQRQDGWGKKAIL